MDWQRNDVLMPLFGWKRADGSRRFRIAYIEIPKKNGKSEMCSGLALYLLCGDGEPGAQIYIAAADRDQAGIVYRESAKMVQASPDLKKRLNIIQSRKTVTYEAAGSFIRVLSSEAYTAEGLNIHGLIFDELHAQPSRDLWDALRYGGAARRQPLLISITTAGYDRNSICWEQHAYAENVLKGVIEDDSFFAYIRAADSEAGDDWTSPDVWKKANPSLGVTIDTQSFTEDFNEAKQSPVKENSFKRYRLNIWTQQENRWLQLDKWDACAGVQGAEDYASWHARQCEALAGQPCTGGIDLSTTTDISALVLYFPEHGGVFLPFFWIPKENAVERERRDRVPYMTWARQGLIEMTPGDTIDYAFIRAKTKALAAQFQISAIGYDPFNAESLCNQQLRGEDGLPMFQFRQGFLSMNEPCKRFEALMRQKELQHGGNPVLRWMAGNIAIDQDPAGNYKPCKARSRERIDGVVAAIMALGISMAPPEGTGRSVYEARGLLSV